MPDQTPHQSFYQSLINFRVDGTTVENTFPNDWRATVARNRAFYVRGTSWFRNNVERTISNIKEPNARIRRVIENEKRWSSNNFEFGAEYAPNQQLYPAFRKKPLLFEKAVPTIIVLYDYCLEKGYGPDVVGRFSIEPAASYIMGLNVDLLQNIEEKKPRYLHNLAEATLQGTKDLIYKLCEEKGTVTHKLAHRIRGAIAEDFRDDGEVYLGVVDIKTNRFSALSGNPGEKIDADDDRVKKKCREIFDRENFRISVPMLYSRDQSQTETS